ncbi:MAG: ATP-binding cassette domain-containing protein, partial [Deltaproteobacteria bacterium]|nr:ATP-binding cassette domain-containing protein [Deltaproteobacteria bacterium]MBW2535374.1 ATP-binding cassette domain-containing protein [Deltaproteobacteria bacterium]
MTGPDEAPLSADPGGSFDETRREALRRFHEEEDLERVYDYRMLSRLWPFLRPEWRYLVGWLVVLLAAAAFGLVRPILMRDALHSFQGPEGAQHLHLYGIAIAVLILLEQVLLFPQVYWMQIAGARGMAALRRRIFRFLHGCPMAFFDRTPIGRLVTRVTNDVDAINEMFSSGALNAVGDLIRLVAIVVIMLSMDWRMSLFAFAVVPPVALGVDWTRRRVRVAYREVRAKTARLNAFLNEQVSGVAVVQAYAREQPTEAEFDQLNARYRTVNMRAIMLEATLDAAMEMVSSICIAAVLWYAGARHFGVEVSFGTLFAFVLYIDMFFVPIRNLSARYTQIQSALAGAERVFQLLDLPERDEPTSTERAAAEHGDAEPAPEGGEPAALELDQVTFGYKPGQTVLDHVSLRVAAGETVALVGSTGSGKTTIASLLLRLYEVAVGTVRVAGKDVRSFDRHSLRSR